MESLTSVGVGVRGHWKSAKPVSRVATSDIATNFTVYVTSDMAIEMVLALWIVANLLTFGAVMFDKAITLIRTSPAKKRRQVSEKSLYFLALMGGAPGGYLAMRLYKHKRHDSKFKARFAGCMYFNILILIVLFITVLVF